jgi:TolB-like protein
VLVSDSSAEEDTGSSSSSGVLSFWGRVHEHKVLQWGLAYLGAALAIAHGTELLGHTFHWPELTNRIVMGTLVVGLPIALALAWYHGHRSLRNIGAGEATIISLLVVIGAGLLVVFALAPAEESAEGERAAAHSAAPAYGTESTQPANVAAAEKSAIPQGPSIAVLPFVNMSSDPEQEYFSDGLAEELLNQLAHLPNLRVIGRTSSFAFKGKNEDLRVIGATLGVNHILEGSVRKAGNHVRITAQLIDPSNGSHLWSDVYDKELVDIFKLQEEIARKVAANLRITIDGALTGAKTESLEAYDEFLRARREGIGPGTNVVATIGHLERAVELDPQFTAAWAALVSAYSGALVNLPQRSAEWLPKQERALSRAVALDPDSPAVKLALAGRESALGHFAKAEALLTSVKDLPPGLEVDGALPYALFTMGVGRPREAIRVLERVRDSDPLVSFPSLLLQISYEMAGDYAAGDAEYQRATRVGIDVEVARGTQVLLAMTRRDPEGLRKAIARTSPTEMGGLNQAMVRQLDDPRAALAQLKQMFSDPNSRPETLRSSVIAEWAAYFGDPGLSLQALRAMPRVGAGGPAQGVLFTLWRPVLKDTRRLPGFKDFVRELGLVDYWRATGKWGDYCRPLGADDFQCL